MENDKNELQADSLNQLKNESSKDEIKNIIVDTDTFMEVLLTFLASILFLVAAILFYNYYIGTPGNYMVNGILTTALFLVALKARMGTDNYYVIDVTSGDIYYSYNFLDDKKLILFKKASDIEAVAVTGSASMDQKPPIWQYRVILIDKKGRTDGFGKWEFEKGLNELNASARSYAGIIGCAFVECPTKNSAVVRTSLNGKIDIFFWPRNPDLYTRLNNPQTYGFMIIIEFGFLVLLAVLLAYLYFFVPHCPKNALTLIMCCIVLTIVFKKRFFE